MTYRLIIPDIPDEEEANELAEQISEKLGYLATVETDN